MRASSVVKRQSTRTMSRLRWSCQASTSRRQRLLIRNPAVQALSGQHSDFNFSHVQPTPMLGGVVNLQTFGDTPRFHRLERLV